jgi:hypothetical protein
MWPLLKAQGQDLAQVIQKAGFDLSEFELTTREWRYYRDPQTFYWHQTDEAPTLVHKATGFYFMFVEVPLEDREAMNHGGDFIAEWSPGTDTRVKRDDGFFWAGLTSAVERWLEGLTSELTAPDVWAELAEETVAGIERGKDPFTEPELQQIDHRLDDLLSYARANYELTDGAVTRLEADITYLKDAARRLPRLDWANAALGTALGWLLSAVVPPERFSGLFHQVVQIIQNVTAALHLLTP